ncbi:MAG: hypothetical protein KatS3mg130_1038 [Candidatus Sumerlaea sp.]|uniref:YfhO family protein n=1 Tax=Sumerlaea chitinivorans TaxID=2250252 RepID=A0A2Z4Y531_SUMC1|nr:hypothetical protein BRCON_0846 [Candidatus Sumerlaea chitinivorans]GIX44630.1 MAG: hypothetical protein KatS3mg130_1038 [Candidatus Sumerlaea sp.]
MDAQKALSQPNRIPCVLPRVPFSLWKLIPIVLGCAVIYQPLLEYGQCFSGMDFLNLLLPHAFLVGKSFAHGVLPLWNWYTWGGSPLLAEMQCASLYPPMWLVCAAPLPYALQLYVWFHIVWGAWGAAVLSNHVLKTSGAAAVMAGLAYAGSGFFLGHVEQPNTIAVLAWTPWLAWATVLFLLQGRFLFLTPWIVGLSLLAGHPQYVLINLIFAELGIVVMVAVQGVSVGSRHRWQLARRILKWHLAVGVGFAIAAIQLLPAAELKSLSERVWPYDDPYAPRFYVTHLLAYVIPRFYNRLAGTSGQPVGYTEEGVYAGILTVVLAVIGSALAVRRRHKAASVLLLGWVLAVAYALGPDGGIVPFLRQLFPELGVFRGTARALNLAALCVALLAALGVEVVSLAVKQHFWRRVFRPFLGLIVVLDLAIVHRPELSSLFVSVELLQERTNSATLIQPTLERPNRVFRFMRNDSDYYLDHQPKAVVQRIYRIQPNLNALHGIALIDGYEEGLLPSWRLGNFLRAYNRNLRNATLDGALLSLLGVVKVLTEYPLAMESPYWRNAGPPHVSQLDGVTYTVWKNSAPTAWFYDEAALYSSCGESTGVLSSSWPEASRRGEQGGVLRAALGQQALSYPLISASPDVFEQAAAKSTFRVAEILPNGMILEVTDSGGRAAVFSQVYCPGWKLRDAVSKQEIGRVGFAPPILSKIDFHEGGRVPKSSKVLLRYEPYSLRLGSFITLMVVALACLYLAKKLGAAKRVT